MAFKPQLKSMGPEEFITRLADYATSATPTEIILDTLLIALFIAMVRGDDEEAIRQCGMQVGRFGRTILEDVEKGKINLDLPAPVMVSGSKTIH